MSESEGDIVQSGSMKGWEKKDVHSFGTESSIAIDEIRKTWKTVKEDDKMALYDTGGGIYLEDKNTGRFTRVGDAIATTNKKK